MDLFNKCQPAKLYFEEYIPAICDGSLPPVVFVHGVCSLHTNWNYVWKRIANETKRKVYTLDNRNHGRSEWNDLFTLEALVVDLENFFIENGINRCVLVSHSLGGRITMYLTLIKPQFVDRIVVEEVYLGKATAKDMETMKTALTIVKKINLLPRSMTEADIRKLFSKLAEEKFPGEIYSNMISYLPLRKDPDGHFDVNFNLRALENSLQMESAYNVDFEKCQKFHGPALFLYSNISAVKVEGDKTIPEYFPEAEFCKFNNSSHCLHTDSPDEYVQKVVQFINK